MKLSRRLEALIQLVPEGSAVLDVGCDHAYVPIALLERGISLCAVASDIRPGPLEAAKEHIRASGLTDRIKTVLADGVPKASESLLAEVGYKEEMPLVLITAGMGGLMIRDILRNITQPAGFFSNILISPQRDADEARKALTASLYKIINEKMIEEDGKYYPLILSEYSTSVLGPLTKEEAVFGPVLMREKNEVFLAYLEKRLKESQAILKNLPPSAAERRAEVEEDIGMLLQVLN